MFSKLVMFPLSASNEPEKEDLKELNGKLNDFHEMVSQLEAVESTMNDDHIIPAGVDVVVEPKKQDKKKSSAAKVDEELDILDDEVKEIEFNLNDHIARIKRLVEIKSTLKKQKQDKKKSYAGKVDKELVILEDPAAKVDEELFILEEVEVIELNLNDYIARIKRLEVIKSTLKKPIDAERYSQADAKQMQLRVAVQATMEIVEKKKEEMEAIAKKKKELKRIEK